MGDFHLFLDRLFESGQVEVDLIDRINDEETVEASELIRTFELEYRLQLPDGIPDVDLETALQAAIRFYRACQCLVYREIEDEQVTALVRDASEFRISSKGDYQVDYSVDLTWRFLPGLLAQAQRKMQNDVLNDLLQKWGVRFPLSSVGTTIPIPKRQIERLQKSPGLWIMFLDRVIDTNCQSSLAIEVVRQDVKIALGEHSMQWKQLNANLERRARELKSLDSLESKSAQR